MEDLTEFDFANTYFEDFSHWEMVTNAHWFKDHIEQWRKELHLKIASRALKRIKAEAQSTSKDAITCAKYLLEKGWVPKEEKTKRGRPSKEELEKTKKEIILAEKSLDDDFLRITQGQLLN